MIPRFRFFKNTFRPDFSLGIFDHFFVERLQRTSSACGNHKRFDGRIRPLVLVLDGNDKPLAFDDEIAFVGEMKFVIQIGHFFGGDIFGKMIDKVLFFVGRFDDATQTFDACCTPIGLNAIDGVEIFGNRNNDIGWNSRFVNPFVEFDFVG
jgi:hypothetical protein